MSSFCSVKRKYLEDLRLARGWSQQTASEQAGMTRSKYQKVEDGRAIDVKVSDIDGLAYAFGMKTIDLLQMEVDYLNGKVKL